MTVLFADLSGYTAVAERMDPEAVKSLVDRALMRLGAEVERYGGTVDKYIGDNVMAIFGAPLAHEDDEERAVRAGARDAGRDGGPQRGPPAGRGLLAAGGDQHRRGARRRGGRELHRHGRHRERGLAPPERGPPRHRDRRRAHHARHPRRRALRGAASVRPEGQGRAGARLGGRLPHRHAQRPAAQPAQRVAARGARQRAGHARDPLRAGRARGRPPPGEPDRRGGRGQVASPARVRACPRRALDRPHGAHRPLPPLRHRHRLLGARRGPARRVRDRGHRLLGGGLAEAVRLCGRTCSATARSR